MLVSLLLPCLFAPTILLQTFSEKLPDPAPYTLLRALPEKSHRVYRSGANQDLERQGTLHGATWQTFGRSASYHTPRLPLASRGDDKPAGH